MDAKQLKDWRKAKGWSQADTAKHFQVSIHAVQSWEQGKNPIPPQIERLILAEVDLKVPLSMISEIHQIATDNGVSFDEAVKLILGSGLKSLRSTTHAKNS
ncbi:helix-turn-helix domain-containing protein [Verrucomicrobium spinosum]|uniref:helix-turn-helix domain-containing protein n=1 Tax=Verrucomicrobium spinosum TaxID=2736 RepID=UPI0001744EA8|nr:helix-turn-helix domain-containing protein [Verrucomicrobium spinosum]